MNIRTNSLENEDHKDAKELTYSVLILIGVLVFGLFAYRQTKDRESWTECQGQVVSMLEQDGWRQPRGVSQTRKKDTVVTISYQYSVSGRTYNGRKVEHCKPSRKWENGATRELVEQGKSCPIDVYYNPKNFGESILHIGKAGAI